MFWQAIAGGGEGVETPVEAAKREAWEEAGTTPDHPFMALDSHATVPAVHFAAFRGREDVFVIPEHCFAVEVAGDALRLSGEHAEYAWLSYPEADAILRWDSNKNTLWELDRRLRLVPKHRSNST
jgi:dATP pyrophosphohydrolase